MTTTYAGQVGGSDYKDHAVQRTDGADTVLEFYRHIAEPESATYKIPFAGIAVSTANSHVLQIMAGASLRVGIKRIRIWQVANATTVAKFSFYIYRLTTAGTGGTTVGRAPVDPADAAAGATAMTLPTAKGTEGAFIDHGRHLIHTTATTVGLIEYVWDFSQLRDKCLWIAAGTSNGIALKNISSDASATYDGMVDVVESAVA